MGFTDLIVWEKGMLLAELIYSAVSRLPQEERYSLSDQMRRAAVSIPSNIAEGYERESPKEKLRFYTFAKGSAAEVETQLLLCERIGYFRAEEIRVPLDLCREIKKILSAMVLNLKNNPES